MIISLTPTEAKTDGGSFDIVSLSTFSKVVDPPCSIRDCKPASIPVSFRSFSSLKK